MSSPTSKELLEDRIKFKFHAAIEHLKNLKCLEAKGGINKNPDARVRCEIEIENLLSHLIGAVDAILVRITKKLNLKIGKDKVCLGTVRQELDSKGRLDLIRDLIDLRDKKIYPDGSWLSKLYDFRNTGTHKSILNVRLEVNLFENTNTGKGSSGPTRIFLRMIQIQLWR